MKAIQIHLSLYCEADWMPSFLLEKKKHHANRGVSWRHISAGVREDGNQMEKPQSKLSQTEEE